MKDKRKNPEKTIKELLEKSKRFIKKHKEDKKSSSK